MPEMTPDSLWIAIILVPGFLAVKVRDFFGPVKDATAFDRFMEAVAFSVANFVLYTFVLRPFLLRNALSGLGESLDLLSGLGLSACVLGVLAGIVVGKDYHYRLARHLGLTSRTGRVDVWQDVFEDIRGNWLMIHMEDGQRVSGWARYYSEEGGRPSIFMRQASWVNDQGESASVDGEGLLITESARVRYIEFLGEGGASGERSEGTKTGTAEGPRAQGK